MERTSFLTADELQAAQVLHKDAPYAISGVSGSMFSLARYTGGIRVSGSDYTYLPVHDECVRDDVLKMVKKMRKAKKTVAPVHVQLGLIGIK